MTWVYELTLLGMNADSIKRGIYTAQKYSFVIKFIAVASGWYSVMIVSYSA